MHQGGGSDDAAVPRDYSVLGIKRLHEKMFGNYKKWCKHLGVEEQIVLPTSDNRSFLMDIALFFLTWGEAANVRHMPEAICFLVHKMKKELKDSMEGKTRPVQRPPGDFLEAAIRPLYNVLKFEADKGIS